MATDVAPIPATDASETRQLAVQQGAVSLLEQAKRTGRFITSVADADAAQALIANARMALAAAASASADQFARSLAELRAIRVDAGPIEEIRDDATRGITEVQLEHGADYQKAYREYIEARLGRRAYEKLNPKAALLRGISFRAVITASVVGAIEIPAGAYLLSQTTSFPGGPIGGAIAAGLMFFWNIKLARGAGILGGRRRSSLNRRMSATLAAIAVAFLAAVGNLALGCLRSDLPFGLGSILTLTADPLQHVSAWVLMTMESAVFIAALGWALGRECAGDNSHYRRLLQQEAEKKVAFMQARKKFLCDLDAESDEHRADINTIENEADAAWLDAAAIYEDVHSERRTLAKNHEGIARGCAAIFRDMWTLALSEHHGMELPAHPDFERDFERMLPMPTVGATELPLARRLFRQIRSRCRTVTHCARSTRGRIADMRLETLRPIYSAS